MGSERQLVIKNVRGIDYYVFNLAHHDGTFMHKVRHVYSRDPTTNEPVDFKETAILPTLMCYVDESISISRERLKSFVTLRWGKLLGMRPSNLAEQVNAILTKHGMVQEVEGEFGVYRAYLLVKAGSQAEAWKKVYDFSEDFHSHFLGRYGIYPYPNVKPEYKAPPMD